MVTDKNAPIERPERDAAIYALAQTLPYAEIARAYDITRERVRQLVHREAVRRGEVQPPRVKSNLIDPLALLAHVRTPGALSYHPFNKLASERVLDAFGLTPAVERLFRLRRSAKLRRKREDIIARIRAATTAPITQVEFLRLRAAGQRYFGAWSTAVEAAGFTPWARGLFHITAPSPAGDTDG